MGNKIFTVLLCNLSHRSGWHFNHLEIYRIWSVIDMEAEQDWPKEYSPIADMTTAHLMSSCSPVGFDFFLSSYL